MPDDTNVIATNTTGTNTTPSNEFKSSEPVDFSKIKFTSNGGNIVKPGDTENDILKVLHGNGIYRRVDLDYMNSFYVFPRMDPYNTITTTREYIFFTKPDLFLYNGENLNAEIAKNSFFQSLDQMGYRSVLQELQYSTDLSKPFINILSNRKTSNIDLSPISADSTETAQNYYGTRLRYRKGSEPADENVTFSVEFEDTRYLEVYLLFRAFDEYEKMKYYGLICPPNQLYIWHKILHDQFGAFKFTVGENGKDILHWAQFWGVYPTNVPREALSDIPQDGHLRFTIQFNAQFVEDMSYASLIAFNKIASCIPASGKQLKLYDNDLDIVTGENASKPYITMATEDNEFGKYKRFRLNWETKE